MAEEVQKPEPSERLKRRLARIAAVRKAKDIKRVRVVPRDENARRALSHPRYGGFRSSGSLELPLDTWTKRRIAEGSFRVEEDRPVEHHERGQRQQHGRERQPA